jgi:hypothetical protein
LSLRARVSAGTARSSKVAKAFTAWTRTSSDGLLRSSCPSMCATPGC